MDILPFYLIAGMKISNGGINLVLELLLKFFKHRKSKNPRSGRFEQGPTQEAQY